MYFTRYRNCMDHPSCKLKPNFGYDDISKYRILKPFKTKILTANTLEVWGELQRQRLKRSDFWTNEELRLRLTTNKTWGTNRFHLFTAAIIRSIARENQHRYPILLWGDFNYVVTANPDLIGPIKFADNLDFVYDSVVSTILGGPCLTRHNTIAIYQNVYLAHNLIY